MVVEDSSDEKNSSNDDNDLEAGTKFDAIQGNLLRGIDNKIVRRYCNKIINKAVFDRTT